MPGGRRGDQDIGAEAGSGAECRRRLVRDSPGADPAAAAPALLHQPSSKGRRSRRQRQLLWAQPNIPSRTPGEPWDRKRHGPPLPLVLLLLQVCSEKLPIEPFLLSRLMRRAKAVQGQPWVFPVLLCKVPPAERAQEPASVQGPRPHLLPWRARRAPPTGSPPALRGAGICKSSSAEPTPKLPLKVEAFILPPFSILLLLPNNVTACFPSFGPLSWSLTSSLLP